MQGVEFMDLSQHYREQLAKDYALLKELEDARRLESDPRRRLKYQSEIDELENQICDYQNKLDSLRKGSNTQEYIQAIGEKASLLMLDSSKVEELKSTFDTLPSIVREKNILDIQQSELREKRLKNLFLSFKEEGILEKKGLGFEEKLKVISKELKIPYETVDEFIRCESISKDIFVAIISYLGLKWYENLDLNFLNTLISTIPNVRNQRYSKIQDQCGTLHILDVSRPIDLDELYVRVNILDEPTSYLRLDLSDFPSIYNPKTDEFDRLGLGKIRQARVPGLQAVNKYQKLMVLGKPGAGKSTFLQHIAIQCNHGKFQHDRVPIFIRLKGFAEKAKSTEDFNFFRYIEQEFDSCGVEGKYLVKILNYGRALILLDGLDEVSDKTDNEVIKGIREFTEKFHKNHFIITCRIAAYEFRFAGFTDIEVADFNQPQIEDFAEKWFIAVHKLLPQQGQEQAKLFIEKLNRRENRPIRELAVTPVLLILTCLVFQTKADFPSNRSELYKQGLDILLVRWDEARGISRDEVYRYLSLSNKINLLGYIASITFEQNEYFIKEIKLRNLIAEFLSQLGSFHIPGIERLNISGSILKAMEVQHGLVVERAWEIYSFSHLTFQEYFSALGFARRIGHTNELKISRKIIEYAKETRWTEVFLLVYGTLTDEECFHIKQVIDSILESEKKLQEFLIWLNQKTSAEIDFYEPFAIRALYFDLYFDLCNIDSSKFTSSLKSVHSLTLSADPSLAKAVSLSGSRILNRNKGFATDYALTLLLARATSKEHQKND
jgi:predicted NACHT family NTPase